MILEQYLRATTPEECVQALVHWGGEAALLAGGTDLIPGLRQGRRSARAVIDLGHIPELSRTDETKQGVLLGSMIRLRALEKNARLRGPLAVLRECAGHVSSMQVRNMATLGGNICNASPAADTVPGLLVLDAIALVYGKQGEREVPLASFFSGPGSTVLQADEILTGVLLPFALPGTGAAYRKYAIRGDSDVAIVGAGARIMLDPDDYISAARIALAAAGPTPLRMERAERMLVGALAEEALLEETAAVCAEDCSPVTDQRATAAYRRDMVRLWVGEALKEAFRRAQKA